MEYSNSEITEKIHFNLYFKLAENFTFIKKKMLFPKLPDITIIQDSFS